MENDDNIDHLHDPEDMLGTTSADNAGREVETELYTKASFIPSLCGNKFSQDAKPHIYFVSNAAMTTHNGIPSIRVLLDQCLGERGEEDVVILCSTTKDALQSQPLTTWVKHPDYISLISRENVHHLTSRKSY